MATAARPASSRDRLAGAAGRLAGAFGNCACFMVYVIIGHRVANTRAANTRAADTDQLAMAALPRASFALLLALLPAVAVLAGAAVLGQIPTPRDLAGIALVIAGVAIHRA